jgi:hypothetical protein
MICSANQKYQKKMFYARFLPRQAYINCLTAVERAEKAVKNGQ